ncbi:hypothetical protein [Yinghuangia soli]|uniref:Sulfatase-modifying factor enzyme domain-containing protein n=1 Tax=Yinghuangia soli TaxID=2908204 RepID=A0AA41Q329_9ACTN|nr:hypothetical protein [Yinghuangia soli]MCF2530635.1 hypothetical protein [Yinghuangia soli]
MPTVMTAGSWAALDADGAAAAARAIAAGLPGVGFAGVEDGPVVDGRVWQRAYFACAGRRYALVPGGRVRLGFDVDRFVPTAGQAASYAQSAAEYGMRGDLHEYLRGMGGSAGAVLSPPRAAVLPTLLVAVDPVELGELVDWDDEDEDAGDDDGDVGAAEVRAAEAALAEVGARLATPDEWEYACGAGVGTLFRWGGEYPGETDPYTTADGPQQAPNRFGLRIAYDPYVSELTSEPGTMTGGDGGEATCGGYGAFLAWLPLASAYRSTPAEDVLADYLGEAWVRPVIDVAPAPA